MNGTAFKMSDIMTEQDMLDRLMTRLSEGQDTSVVNKFMVVKNFGRVAHTPVLFNFVQNRFCGGSVTENIFVLVPASRLGET